MVEEGNEWTDDIQAEMAVLVQRTEPSDDMPIDEYLDTIYKAVAYDRGRKSAAREQLRRIRAAKAETEPTASLRPSKEKPTSITSDMNENDAVALAVAMAQKEMAR